ncbi:MAG: ATPase, T2SS/T4P/T4SS family, partial [Planctomycetota bacterium]
FDPTTDPAAAFGGLWQPDEEQVATRTLEDVLQGRIAGDVIEQAKSVLAKSPGRALERVLVETGADETVVYQALAELHDTPFVDEKPTDESIQQAVDRLSLDFCKNSLVIPVSDSGKVVRLGVTDPADIFLLDEATRRLGDRQVEAVVVTPGFVAKVCESLDSDGQSDLGNLNDIIGEVAEDDVSVVEEKTEDADDLEKAGSESPVIRFVNYLIADAIKQGASDIHIEPKEKQLQVRYRIDGILFSAMSPPFSMAPAISSRLKIMANLDIAERRVPQDGRIRAVVQGRKIDLRMSTLPTVAGEKIVIRILDNRSINVPLEKLGFSDDHLATWRDLIDQPHGILLVTGPTGSGKTTTLYSSLRCMDGAKLNISTVEDPVEYHLQAANQVQVTDKIGMTFSAALRSLLRQDPDVVMLGEIRDGETARIAVQASLTGHLVLSTLHTNDAPASITRLINIGVEPYLISAAVNGILAQRLIRKVCPHCQETFVPSDEAKAVYERNGFDCSRNMTKGVGCDKCRQTGYTGRLGLYELLKMDDALRDAVTTNPEVNALRRQCREAGLVVLREDGWNKVEQGLTTVDEVLRVTEG